MVMEYLGHGDLAARIVPGGVGIARAVAYMKSILQGLAAIHAQGVVHRDLKPANVMFRYDDSLALTDFGISKRVSDDPGFTTTGSVVGTPSYVSPEQAEGDPAQPRSDLYSAGVILHELLTGRRPYVGASAAALFMQHAAAPVPELPAEVSLGQDLLDGLMAKDPAQRFASAEVALDALEQVAARIEAIPTGTG
jgi:serine/threonine-protein kinase PpkA